MIYTSSVLRGYNASLGFIFLNLSFLIGTLTIDIPDDKELKAYNLGEMESLYALQIAVHALAVILIGMNLSFKAHIYMEFVTELLDSIVIMLMIVTYMYQWQTFLTI